MGVRIATPEDEEIDVVVSGVSSGFIKGLSLTAKSEGDDPFLDVKNIDGVSSAQKRKITRFEKAFTGAGGAKSKSRIEEALAAGITGYGVFDVMEPELNLDYLAKLYTANDANFAAIRAKTYNIVGLGFDFLNSEKLKRKIDETEDAETVKKLRRNVERKRSESFDFLDTLNAEDEFLETLIKMYTDYEATGNGYLEIGRTTTGDIGYIGHIPSKTMRVRRIRDGFVQIINDKATFFRNYGGNAVDPINNDRNPNEVLHFKKYSPTDTYYGVPDIVAAMDSVLGNELAAKYNLDYFDNKAVPRYIIVMKSAQHLSPSAQAKIANFFDGNLRGENHRTLFVPMPPDGKDYKNEFEMKPVEAGQQDASFKDYDKKNLASILMVHRVPISKVSLSEGVNLAAARDADKTFVEQVCRPEQRIIEKKLNRVFSEINDMFKFKLNELSLSDEDITSQIEERYLRWGVITANEIRAKRGEPSVSWGDKQAFMATDPAAKAATTSAGASASQQKAVAGKTRTRDANRSAGATDSKGQGRATQGAGRSTA